jgi:hypothetical protein
MGQCPSGRVNPDRDSQHQSDSLCVVFALFDFLRYRNELERGTCIGAAASMAYIGIGMESFLQL